ncbi:MAG: transposase [Tannerella sp.]|nr:transposase [Tannerella sp.]
MVLYNAKYQHCRAVMEKVGEPGITLLFLPPYFSNLNIVERLWKFTKNKFYMPNIMMLPINFMMPLMTFLILSMINALII